MCPASGTHLCLAVDSARTGAPHQLPQLLLGPPKAHNQVAV